jgi:hypothetical protein
MIWPLMQAIYLTGGALVTPTIIALLFSRTKAWGDLSNPIAAFVIVIGTLLMWPMLLARLINPENRT